MKEVIQGDPAFKPSNLHEFDGAADETVRALSPPPLTPGRTLNRLPSQENYETSLQELHSQVQEHITPLLTDPSTVVKRALLGDIGALCVFFGRPEANDAVLAHLVTYLNTHDWLLRKAWNEHALEVALCVGPRSLEEYILPLITLSLSGAPFCSLQPRLSHGIVV